jgi:PAS domain S-box-containing protein
MSDLNNVLSWPAVSDGAMRYAVDQSMEGLALLDAEGCYTYMNPAHAAMYGFTPDELMEKSWKELYEPHTIALIEREYVPLLLTQGHWRGELIGRKKTGSLFSVEVSLNLVKRERGQPEGLICTCRNVTEQKDRERALRQSQMQYHSVITALTSVVFQTDAEGNWLFLSPAWTELTGYLVEESLNASFLTFMHPDDRHRHLALLALLIERKQDHCRSEIRYLTKEGGYRWVEVFARPILNEDGAILGTSGTLNDITERKQQEALQVAEKRVLEMVSTGTPLQKVLEHICLTVEAHAKPVICSILLTTEDGSELTLGAAPHLPDAYNQAIEGLRIGPAVGSFGSAAYHKKATIVADIATDPLWKDFCGLALGHGLRACWSVPLMTPTGDVLGTFALYYRQPRTPHDADFELIGKAGRLAEIAIIRSRLIESLQRSEEQFRHLFEDAHLGMCVVGEDKRLMRANRAFCELVGCEMQEVLGQTHALYTYPDDLEANIRQTDAFTHKDGRVRWVQITASALEGIERGNLLLVFEDITEQKQAEEEVRKSEDRLSQAVQAENVGIFEHDHQAETFYWSSTIRAIFGVSTDKPASLQGYLDLVHQEDRDEIVKAVSRTHDPSGDGRFVLEHRLVRGDGSICWVRVQSRTHFEGAGASRFPVRTIGAMVDVTRQKQTLAVEALRLSEDRLELAHSIAGLGMYDWDVPSGAMRVSEVLGSIFGFPVGSAIPTIEYLVARIHPQDKKRTSRVIGNALKQRELSATEYRIVWPDGSIHWLLDRFKIFRNEAGIAVRVLGTLLDVTAQKQAEEALRQNSKTLESRVKQRTSALSEAVRALNGENRARRRLEQEREKLLDQVTEGRACLEALSRNLIETQETERRNLSHDLHDEVGQSLTALKVNLQSLSSNSKCNTSRPDGLRCCHENEILSTHEC